MVMLRSRIGVGATIDSGTTEGQMVYWDATDRKWTYTEVTELFWNDSNKRLGINTNTPNTKLDVQGGMTHEVTTVNASTYDLLITDYILNVTYTSTGAVTSLTLPTAQTVSGRVIVIKDAGGNASVNTITIDTEGSEKIDGADTLILSVNYSSVSLYSDGSNWFILG